MENDINLYVNLTHRKKSNKNFKINIENRPKEVGFTTAFIISIPTWVLAGLFAAWVYR